MELSRTKLYMVSLVGLLFGFALTISGILLFKSITSYDEPPAMLPSGMNSEAVESDGRGLNESISTVPTAREIERILNPILEFERPLILHRLLVDADTHALGVLFDQSEHLKTSKFQLELQVGVVRLMASANPRKTLARINTLQGNSKGLLIATVFEEWSIADLDEAVEFAQELNESDQAAALDGILRSRIDLTPHQIVDLGTRMATIEEVERVVALRLVGATVRDPESLWHMLMDTYGNDVNVLSDAQLQLLNHAASSLFERKGIHAVQEISSSMGNHESRIAVLGELISRMAKNDPKAAFNLAAQIHGLDLEIVERVIRIWTQTEPLSALNAAMESGDAKGPLQIAAIDAWASSNPTALYQSLVKIPTLLRTTARNKALYSMAEIAPDSAVGVLAEIDDIGLKNSVSKHIANHWPQEDLSTGFDWSVSNERISNEMRSEMQQVLLERMAHTDPQGALNLALDQEVSGSEPGLEAKVIEGVAEVSVDVAIEMLGKARNQATREKAYSSIGLALVRKGRYSRAIELVKDASLDVQREYYNKIAYAWARVDFKNLIASKESLPDDWLVRQMVNDALDVYQW